MRIVPIEGELSVCKLAEGVAPDLSARPLFVGLTDNERSLVCPTASVPAGTVARDDDWRAFRVDGTLDFALIGIMAGISSALAEAGISVFAVSTYDTDYVLTHAADFDRALEVLSAAGYEVADPVDLAPAPAEPPAPEPAAGRLAAFEAFAADVRAELAAATERMGELRAQRKVKSATYQQLFANRAVLREIDGRLSERGL